MTAKVSKQRRVEAPHAPLFNFLKFFPQRDQHPSPPPPTVQCNGSARQQQIITGQEPLDLLPVQGQVFQRKVVLLVRSLDLRLVIERMRLVWTFLLDSGDVNNRRDF